MPETPSQRVLAFDFGARQIGVACGQTLTRSAQPVSVLRARDGQPDWTVVAGLISDWQPSLLLVGLPLNMDDSESDLCIRARKFGKRLHGRFGLPVVMVDERLSTREAKSLGVRGERDYRKNPVDALAAQIICESWLSDPDGMATTL